MGQATRPRVTTTLAPCTPWGNGQEYSEISGGIARELVRQHLTHHVVGKRPAPAAAVVLVPALTSTTCLGVTNCSQVGACATAKGGWELDPVV
jgi:hypothetical protein